MKKRLFVFMLVAAMCGVSTVCEAARVRVNIEDPYIKYFVTSGYIQNESISNNISYSVSPLYIGRDVTTQKSFGDVIINNGAKLTIYNGTGGVTIPNGFECKSGGELSIE